MTSFLWDQHTCLPLQITADVDQLTRYRRPGGALVSVNAGYSPHTFAETVALLQYYRTEIEAHPELDVAADLDEVEAITDAGRIAVVFISKTLVRSTEISTISTSWPASGCAHCYPPTTTPTVPGADVSTPPTGASHRGGGRWCPR